MLNRLSGCVALLAIVAAGGLTVQDALAANANVIFTEVMTEPNIAGMEWVEIYNLTDQDIDLSGWVIDDAQSGYAGPTEANIVSGTLPANGTAVLYDNRGGMMIEDMQAVWGAGINFVPVLGDNYYWPNLDPSDTIGLWDSHASYIADNPGTERDFTNAVAVLEYGNSAPWPEPGPLDEGKSLYLTDLNDPLNGEKWAISTPGDEGIVENPQVFATNAANLGIVPAGTPTASTLVITEIYYNSLAVGTDETPYEAVEIYNNSGETIDFSVTPWVIDDINGTPSADGAANITEGVIGPGEVAVLYNATTSDEEFAIICSDSSVNKIPVTNWTVQTMALTNGGDTVSLWDSYSSYAGDHQTHANAVVTVAYDDYDPWPRVSDCSIYLTNLGNDPADGASWASSSPTDGISYPVGPAHQYGSPGNVEVGGGTGEDPLPGDLNDDGFVNSGDLDIVRANWGASVPAGNVAMGDPSNDGLVGSADLDIVRANWGASAPASVPEPAGFVLLAVGAVLATLRRR